MASLEGFESTLKEVVNAKRLSASKIEKLTGIALQLMEHDTQLVSTLYRTHNSLSGVSKIHSLYAFDALARAARNNVVKQKVDVHSIVGNSATFLIKMEGVLEGLIKDMISLGQPEAKEKTKKILDIWQKSNTFPSGVIARLHNQVKEAEKEPNNTAAAAVTADPRAQSISSSTTLPRPAAPAPATAYSAESAQNALLALLSQAANAVTASENTQIAPNMANLPSGPRMDPPPHALFQQLAQASNSGPTGPAAPSQRIPVPMSVMAPPPPAHVPFVAPPVGVPPQNLPFRDDRNGFARREPQHDRFNGPPRGRDIYDHRGQRGGFRGNPRGRGRGRWDDRDRPYERQRGNEWNSPPSRQFHSRSRSPVGRNGRNVRPYSPPRRPNFHQGPPSPLLPAPSGQDADADKDEFGRELRASAHAPDLSPSRSASIPVEDHRPSPPDRTQDEEPAPSSTHSMPPPTASPPADTKPSKRGLESFDFKDFSLTDASSWEALANAWNTTRGYVPSQDELMQYTMSRGVTNPIPTHLDEDPPRHQWSDEGRGRFNSRRRGRGGPRSSFGRGYDYDDGQEGFWGNGRTFDQDTDALTLAGGDDEPTPFAVPINDYPLELPPAEMSVQSHHGESASSVGAAGKMQRVGDRWMFVRTEAA